CRGDPGGHTEPPRQTAGVYRKGGLVASIITPQISRRTHAPIPPSDRPVVSAPAAGRGAGSDVPCPRAVARDGNARHSSGSEQLHLLGGGGQPAREVG